MTLKDKINLLNLKPRNAPEGVSVSAFGKWLRMIRKGKDPGGVAVAFLTLYCDGRINEDGRLKVGLLASSGNPEQTIVERVRPHIDSINESYVKIKGAIKDLPYKAVKSNAPIWVDEGHVDASGVNTYFKVNGQLWKVMSGSVSGLVDFGGDIRDVKSFKSK